MAIRRIKTGLYSLVLIIRFNGLWEGLFWAGKHMLVTCKVFCKSRLVNRTHNLLISDEGRKGGWEWHWKAVWINIRALRCGESLLCKPR